jgi:hypothetical protein
MMRASLSFMTLLTVSGTAVADPAGSVERVSPVTVDGPAPSVTIVQPAPLAHFKTHRTASPQDKYTALECLLEQKDQVIRLSATNWPVKPGGPGMLVVVDGGWSTTVHDLSKPIQLADLVPYGGFENGNVLIGMGDNPMSTCGWHFVAAVPTRADGRMAPVAPVISWYLNVHEPSATAGDPDPDSPPLAKEPITIVNLPLIGTFYVGAGQGGPDSTGYVTKAPDHIPFDYTMINAGQDCHAQITMRGLTEMGSSGPKLPDPQHGMIYIAHADHNETLTWKLDCDQHGRVSQIQVYDHKPALPGKAFAWPVAGKNQVDNNYYGENKDAVNKQIRKSRCKDGHRESCD